MAYSYDKENVRLLFRFAEAEDVTLLDFSSLMYDLTLLHDLCVLITLPEYEHYNFGPPFWFRKTRGIKEHHQIYLGSINHQSPIELITIITATAAFSGFLWILIQGIEKISNWDLNREKLQLDVDVLKQKMLGNELDNERKRLDNVKKRVEITLLLKQRKAIETFNKLIKRLEKNPIKAYEVDILSEEENEGTQYRS
jgi:hypothetical protein